MEFSRNLKFLLSYRKVKQGDLATNIGVGSNTISNYINSVSKPSFELLGKIIKILDVTSDEILYQKLDSTYLENRDRKNNTNYNTNYNTNSEKTVYVGGDSLNESKTIYGQDDSIDEGKMGPKMGSNMGPNYEDTDYVGVKESTDSIPKIIESSNDVAVIMRELLTEKEKRIDSLERIIESQKSEITSHKSLIRSYEERLGIIEGSDKPNDKRAV